ncbi:Protein CBG01238 [Caenorhabditis briggsae]|uniref:Protein CBG01238 n=1 Tax=Caenorhabditis briggsae TaxID=6238 RepID=A8WPX2_CAEBR|nr:Protein CBG01238 [Caenorhabditis briggsae]CAP22530.1 Protein CBG01238 [Caenorhabditis briggsae]
MSHAYQWLTDRQRNNISQIIFTFSNRNIYLFLLCPSAEGTHHIRIAYESFGEATSVISEKMYLAVDKNCVDVFCDDLAMIIKNQESVLNIFQASLSSRTMGNFDEPISDTNANRISASIENALKSRSSLLWTKTLSTLFASVSQSISMIRYLDPKFLKCADFSFGDLVDCRDLICFKKLENIYRISVFLRFNTVTEENIHSFNELLTFSKMFVVIQIVFAKCHYENWMEILDPKFKREANRDKLILFFHDHSIHRKSAQVERTVSETMASKTEARKILVNPLAMKLILEELDCFDVLKLRKVSSGIRNCIDELKSDPHVKSYTICLDKHHHSTLIELTSGAYKEIKYLPVKTGGCVNNHYFKKLDARAQSLKDAETILKNMKACLEELRLVYHCFSIYHLGSKDYLGWYSEKFSVAFGKILRKRSTPLKIKRFAISCKYQNEVMAILPHIDPRSLKILEILYPSKQVNLKFENIVKVRFEVDRISETKQWRNAEQLIGNYLIITTPIQKIRILHFVNLDVLVECLSTEDVVYLKTNLLGKPIFQKFRISFLTSTIDESLNELIGEPYRTVPNIKKAWYFRIPYTEYYMHIALDIHNLIILMILFLLFTGLVAYLFHELYWKRRNLPPGPIPIPLIGNMLGLVMEKPGYECFRRWTKKYGDIYTFWLGELKDVPYVYRVAEKY